MLTAITKLTVKLTILIAAGWCVLVIYFAPILADQFRGPAAIAIAISCILALYRPRVFLAPLGAILLAVVICWSQITPTNDGDWQVDVSKLPWVERNGDELTFHNVRDFRYRTETDFDPSYVTKKVRLSDFSSVSIFTSYWAGKAIAHLFVSFGFADRDYISISIEARKTKQQSYSTLGGFFRNFNLIYVVAEERDLVTLRTEYRQPNEQVHLLRGRFNRTPNTKFLLEYIAQINKLRENPTFYNSLTTNCTTQVLANAQPGNPLLKYDWRLLLSGYTPEYLYRAGSVETGISLEELMQKGLVNPRSKPDLNAQDFSAAIRQGVPLPAPVN